MLRLDRLTDYGTVIMAYLAIRPARINKAKEIAEHTGLNIPTVSKLLKLLTRAGLLTAQRGAQGGYRLALAPEQISLIDIINALEGGIALTLCSLHGNRECTVEKSCILRHNWRAVTQVVAKALEKISLAQMLRPLPNHFLIDL